MKGLIFSIIMVLMIITTGAFVISRADPITLDYQRPRPTAHGNNATDRTPNDDAIARVSDSRKIIINVSESNNSGETGTVDISETGNNSIGITLNLRGFPPHATQPVFIKSGTCESPGKILYPLTPVKNGISKTVMRSSLEKIKNNSPAVITVYKSLSEPKALYSCGSISGENNLTN